MNVIIGEEQIRQIAGQGAHLYHHTLLDWEGLLLLIQDAGKSIYMQVIPNTQFHVTQVNAQ